MKKTLLVKLMGAAMLAATVSCTTVDPYTGQQRIDYGATAGVAGLALGATALAVAADKDDKRDTVIIDRRPVYGSGYRGDYRPPYRPYRHHRRLRAR